MNTRTPILALLAVLGLVACNVDNDADGVAAHLDCDDDNATIYADAPELCDGLDNDCNGLVDDDTTDAPEYYQDFDRDGFGDPDSVTTDCSFLESAGGPDPDYEPFGYVKDNTDCDDSLNTVNPDADERCDGIDNDCDGEVDEDDAIDKSTWYADTDSDGFGDPASTQDACDMPTGYVADDTDCDDSKDTVNPDETEVCDGDDNDCDSLIDEDDAADAPAWYRDADEDSYGDAADSVFSCSQPAGYIADNTDCNDEAATANPAGTEICDGLDNDCDTSTSEAGTVSLNATDAHTSIQDAVDAAAEGDTVYVCEGTWLEDVIATTPINIVGTGADQVTVEGSAGGNPVFGLYPESAATYRIEGMTIRGGLAEFGGGGIDARSAGGLEVADCVVEENIGTVGGGIAGPFDGDTTITDSTIQDNEVYGDFFLGETGMGGGVILTDGAILDSRVLNNAGSFGGGVVVYDGATAVSLEGTRIISNYASAFGGGLVVWPGATATGGQVLNNLTDGTGGGAYIGGSIEDMELSNNRAVDSGGGVGAASGESLADIDNCIIDGNSARDGGGVVGFGPVTITDTEITDNTATNNGGGGAHVSGDVVLDTCVIEGNTATEGGGYFAESSTIESITSDWGTGSTENDPDDVSSAGTSYSAFGASESFVCDGTGDCS